MPQVFAEPGRLWLVVLLGVVALLVARGTARRRAEWQALGRAEPPPPNGLWPWWIAAACLIVALAEPRWGREPGSEPLPGHDLVLLVDVSRSMGAEDAVPDRLGLATAAARSLIEPLRLEPGDRAAIVAFAGRAVVRCPLTENLDVVVDRLDELRPGLIEPGGTDLGAGLAAALEVFGPAEHAEGRSIVIFSDGEDHAGTWPATVGQLVAAAIPVHTVAIGDPEKSVPVPAAGLVPGSTPSPAAAPLTRRTDAALTQLAHATGGASIPLGVARTDLGKLYRDSIRPTTRGVRPPPRFSERAERYAVFVSAALAAGLWGTWPPPRRRFRSSLGGSRWAVAWGRLLVLVLIALGLVLASLAATPPPPATEGASATVRGLEAYRAGRYADALTAFEETTARAPANPVGPFNAGASLFALGRWADATRHYEAARERAESQGNSALTVKIDYALGNSAAMAGDFADAVQHYDACLAYPDRRTDLEPVRRDAAINRAYILARLKPPADPPEGSGGDQDPEGNDSNSPEGNRNRQRTGKQPNSPGNSPDGSGSDQDSTGSRGAGGAGGSGAALPDPGSPDQRLNAALQRIRAAREKRPDDPAPVPRPTAPNGSAKDW